MTVSGNNLFSAAATPPNIPDQDPGSIELGMKFTSSVAGTVTGVRYYKNDINIGTHTGSLWTSTGTRLATVNFTNESGVGWQAASFSSPVAITPGTTYIISYHASYGHYAATGNYFSAPVSNGPITAPINAGVYAYGANSVFPNNNFGSENYWVDVLFNPSTSTVNQPPRRRQRQWFHDDDEHQRHPDGGEPAGQRYGCEWGRSVITGVTNGSNGSATFNSTNQTVTFMPVTGYNGPATFGYAISDSRGGTSSATVSLNVVPPASGLSIFTAADTPNTVADSDTAQVNLGVKFQASAAGTISGIRYYKSATDTGTHTGTLWSSTGTLLATGTFINETASGWQTLTFTSPVTIAAGTTYVASYHSNGHYIANSGYFSTAKTNGPLTALANATSSNGVYTYGNGNLFPTSTFGAANYWVDVLYNQGTSTNSPPVAVADSRTTTQNTALVLDASNLTANDSDPERRPSDHHCGRQPRQRHGVAGRDHDHLHAGDRLYRQRWRLHLYAFRRQGRHGDRQRDSRRYGPAQLAARRQCGSGPIDTTQRRPDDRRFDPSRQRHRPEWRHAEHLERLDGPSDGFQRGVQRHDRGTSCSRQRAASRGRPASSTRSPTGGAAPHPRR